MAGESAREVARRARERAERLERRAEMFERGADGEEASAAVLTALPPGWATITQRPAGRHSCGPQAFRRLRR